MKSRYRFLVCLACLAIEHIFVAVGYVYGLIFRSFKDGSTDGRFDRENRINRKYIRDYLKERRLAARERRASEGDMDILDY